MIKNKKNTNVIFTHASIKLKQEHVINNIGNLYFRSFSLLVNNKIGRQVRYIVSIHSLYLLFLLTFINPVFASNHSQSSYCRTRRLGWHFYCEEPKKENEIKKTESIKKNNLTPEQELKNIQEELEHKKILAILYPTEENIKNYIIYQREQLDRSSIFAQKWQRTVWANPELDYSLIRPTNTIANRAWIDNRIKEEQKILKEFKGFNKRYGIFFIYKASCPYCHAYAPIIKSFSEQNNLSIIPVTIDGKKLKEFPNSLIENGQLKALGIANIVVPATLIYDNENKQLIPIGYGALSQDELTSRILKLLKIEVGNDL